MALSLAQVYARSAWRVRAVFTAAASVAAGDFTVARVDGGPCTITVLKAIAIDSAATELVLSERMLSGIHYTLTWLGGPITLAIGMQPPAPAVVAAQAASVDLDALTNGVDLAWTSDPGPDGDCQRRSGLPCVEHDLLALTSLRPTELVQYPTAGAALDLSVNSSLSDNDLLQKGAALEAQYRGDDRVQDAATEVVVSSDGAVTFATKVQTRSGQTTTVRTNQ